MLNFDNDKFQELLDSAAEFQECVPNAVMVGGTAAILYAGHRMSYDHDHVLNDLISRYDQVRDALLFSGEWISPRRASRKPMTLMGKFKGYSAGVRQLRRSVPLEVCEFDLISGKTLMIPTLYEMIRIKAFLVVDREFSRDYLDLAVLFTQAGIQGSLEALKDFGAYYEDIYSPVGDVETDLCAKLLNPSPIMSDTAVGGQWSEFIKVNQVSGLWSDWNNVESVLKEVGILLCQ